MKEWFDETFWLPENCPIVLTAVSITRENGPNLDDITNDVTIGNLLISSSRKKVGNQQF